MDIYNEIKKRHGERFAQTVRNFHNGILEIPNVEVILRHAGNEAEPLLPYLMSVLTENDKKNIAEKAAKVKAEDPFVLLDKAGYNAFYADSLQKQNSIKKYFEKGELLCTFNDSSRYQRYHIVHAVKKDVDNIKRDDFRGKEKREDEYGTSVISIQILKDTSKGRFISIKNRYNHTVKGCDNTFNSNPDNIIEGLSDSLKAHFNVDFNATKINLPNGFTLIDKNIFKYNIEENNIYYGNQAWAKDGVIHEIDTGAGDALFDKFRFDNKTKTLIKIDPKLNDSFADNFNRFYGENEKLNIQGGNLMLGGETLIKAENSKITELNLPAFTEVSNKCLQDMPFLKVLNLANVKKMGNWCFIFINSLSSLNAENLEIIGNECFKYTNSLKQANISPNAKVPKYLRKFIPLKSRLKSLLGMSA